MKKGVLFWLTFTLSLLAMTALTGTSSQSITVLPGPVKVKQGNNVTLWCKLEGDPKDRPPVTWQSPLNFQTRTSDCISYNKTKYFISCAGKMWYNMTIVDVQWSDNGKYKCISNIYKIVDLQVLVPVTEVSLINFPPYKKELLFLDKDSDPVLNCTTNCAHPASSISWLENDQPINGSVEVTECAGERKGQKRTKSTITIIGKYVGEERKPSNISCTAGNIKGEPKVSRTVNVRYNVPVTKVSLTHIPPRKEKLLQLGKDSYAVLTCTTDCAYPAPNISWFKNDQPINGSVEVTECTGERKGQKRTKSTVSVTGKYVGEERKPSNISCTAGNVKGEPMVSRMVNVRFNVIPKPPQPGMTKSDTVAAIVVPVLVIVVIIIIIIIVVVPRLRKKRKDVKSDEGELDPFLQKGRVDMGLLKYVIYEYDDTCATHDEGIDFLEDLCEGLQKHGLRVELREVKQYDDRTESKVLEELDQESRSKKVILYFPEDQLGEDRDVETFNAVFNQGGEQSFVAVIIQTEAYMPLHPVLQRIEKLWNDKKRQTQGFGRAKYHLQFLKDTTDEATKQVDVTLMNLGTGLAWSYYLGYLMYLLPVFKRAHQTPSWRNENPDITEKNISKQIHIVFTTNCQQPKIMYNSERIKQKLKIPDVIYRAGVKRDYYLPIQEVKSKDGKESYYGVVCFLTAVQCLSEMEDDPNKRFFLCDEDDVRTHGKDCFEKLKLIIKHNEKIKEDQSKFDFIEFNPEAANADENDLADELFNRMKETCSLETRSPIQEAPATDIYQTGVLSDLISKDVREFVENLPNSNKITNCPYPHGRIKFGLDIIRESKRIFMVLTDDFVKSGDFAKLFYRILDKGFQINDKRFLVCLNCLNENVNYPKVLELEQLFCCVCFTPKWADMVKRELEGNVENIRYDQLSHNIGTGLAMSWYYKFLKIKIPKVRDVIDQCPFLKKQFVGGGLSHKVFILLPSSCCCPDKVPCGNIIEEVDSNVIKLPRIKKDNRDYTPKVYRLKDDGKEYYAFVEFSTPADTMYRMTQEGFLKMPQDILQEEWERFLATLHTLINHKYEPMDIKNRVFFIPYKDANLEDQDLEYMLLDHVKEQIPPLKERKLPGPIDNGARVAEVTEDKETNPAPEAPAAMHEDTMAGLAGPDVIAHAKLIDQ